jgi:formate dehydrogenase subunit gamma
MPILLLSLLLASLRHAWPVPNNRAVPAYAEEQTILQAERTRHARAGPGLDRIPAACTSTATTSASTAAPGGDVIVQRGGNQWRVLRNGPLATPSPAPSCCWPLLIAGFLVAGWSGKIKATIRIPGGASSASRRWERIVHWATAHQLPRLAVTGLVILFGKKLLMPLAGPRRVRLHGLSSPSTCTTSSGRCSSLCSVLMFFTFLHRNFLHAHRLAVGQARRRPAEPRARAGRLFNAGEKSWFWGGVTLLGLVMSATGLVLDFVTSGQTRYVLQVANYLHVVGATLLHRRRHGPHLHRHLGHAGAYHAMRHGTSTKQWAAPTTRCGTTK